MELDFNVLWKVAAVVFAAGGLWNELRAIRKDLSRLESKQDKYNHLQERVAKLEDSCANAHKRISEMHYRRRDDGTPRNGLANASISCALART